MPTKQCRRFGKKRFFRPLVEALEDRRLLAAVITVNSTADIDARDAFLTLREAISINNRTLAVASLSASEQELVSGTVTNADADTINFAIAGTGVQTISPTSALPAITDPVTINGYSQAGASANANPVGQGLNTVLTIEVAGNAAGNGTHGLQLSTGSGGSTIKGLVINRFAGDGIRVDSGGNILVGNFVGTNPLGSAASVNGASGVHVLGANNTVGGTAAADWNLLSGNTTNGLLLEGAGAIGNVVQGNLMATNAAGTGAVPNGGALGIVNAAGNTIGGTGSGAGNLLSGSTFDGVVIFGAAATVNSVQGNLIGTNVSGTAALANGRHGVWVLQSGSGNTIGGTAVGARNVISGNTQVGVLVESSSGTVIQGNFVGVDAAGQAKLGNVRDGVVIFNGSNTIGGTAAGAGNVIGGNGLPGITIVGTGSTVVQGNWIGTNPAGIGLGNGSSGVLIANSSGNTIGGSPGGNTIAFNAADGIAITAQFAGQAVGNQIQANSIYSNVGLGIDLADNGADFPQDSFNGPGLNNRQNFPILTAVTAMAGGTTVSGTLLGPNGATKHRIDFFANAAADVSGFGEGQTFLGSLIVNGVSDSAVTFTATLPALPAGQTLVTTTATDITDRGSGPLNNTSEFSPPFLPPTVYTVTTTANSGAGSLRAAITAANAHAGFDRIEFAIVATDAGHFYYQDDGVAGQVTLAKVATTTAVDDAGLPTTGISAVDPDWPHAWFSIRPTAALPDLAEPVVIDGYTQAGASANTNPAPQGLNSVLRVELSGQDAGAPPVGFAAGFLRIGPAGASSTIRGLVINRASGTEVQVVTSGVRFEGNYLGPDVSGTLAFAGTATDGIVINSGTFDTVVGGTTAPQRNLISANLTGVATGTDTATSVQGNLIGTSRTGEGSLGNVSAGISLGRGSTIGGPTPAATNVISGNFYGVLAKGGTVQNNLIGTGPSGTLHVGNLAVGVFVDINGTNTQIIENEIAFNGSAPAVGGGLGFGAGVRIYGGQSAVVGNGNVISQNAIFANFGPGIDLGSDGVTPNDVPPDSTPPDKDQGPNLLQNYPVLTSVTDLNPGTRIQGTLSSTPSSNFRLEFYANPERDEDTFDFLNLARPGEFGEGKTFIGALDVTTDVSGLASFIVDLPVGLLALPGATGQPFVTATATDITDSGSGPRNNTSEFSRVAVLGGLSFVVKNTNDSGLGTLREAIFSANLTADEQTITFAIPAGDPRHFYYKNDGIADSVTLANLATTTAATDAAIPTTGASAIDPDWPHSWFSIQPTRTLPAIADIVTIDGYSQPGSNPNTLPSPQALDTVLKVELSGVNLPGTGLRLNEPFLFGGSVIRGLALNRWTDAAIELDSDGGFLFGTFIGTDISGTLALGSGDGVIVKGSASVSIGSPTPASRNLISGNEANGIHGLQTLALAIQGNLIGTDRTGVQLLENQGGAIHLVQSSFMSIGGSVNGAGNVIMFDTSSAILLQTEPSSIVTILGGQISTASSDTPAEALQKLCKNLEVDVTTLRNRIELERALGDTAGYTIDLKKLNERSGELSECKSALEATTNALTPLAATWLSNKVLQRHGLSLSALPEKVLGPLASIQSVPALAIDLGGDGVTPNDANDGDSGPNDLLNYPVLSSATTIASATVITGSLDTIPNASVRIEFYSNPTVLLGGHGPGENFLGFVNVVTNANGHGVFVFNTPNLLNGFVTSTATLLVDVDNNSSTPNVPFETSEFSAGVAVRENPWHNKAKPLDVTKDGHVIAEDVLVIINRINAAGSGPVPADAVYGVPNFYDTTNDASVAPDDVLKVINAINAGLGGEGEGNAGESSVVALADDFRSDLWSDLLALMAFDSAQQVAVRRGVRR